jgi:hypothetical protein
MGHCVESVIGSLYGECKWVIVWGVLMGHCVGSINVLLCGECK